MAPALSRRRRRWEPSERMLAVEMLARHEKPLFAVESKRALKDFDTLGFSLAYELGGTNILEMLKLSGECACGATRSPTGVRVGSEACAALA